MAFSFLGVLSPSNGLTVPPQNEISLVQSQRATNPARLQNQTMMNTTSGTSDTSCLNLKQNLTVSCWDSLGMSDYLQKWWSQNEAHCQSIMVGFASCYQQSLGIEQQACDTTGPGQCDFPINFAAGGYSPQEAYALYTIFGIWQWFQSIYSAIENADVSVSCALHRPVMRVRALTVSGFRSRRIDCSDDQSREEEQERPRGFSRSTDRPRPDDKFPGVPRRLGPVQGLWRYGSRPQTIPWCRQPVISCRHTRLSIRRYD